MNYLAVFTFGAIGDRYPFTDGTCWPRVDILMLPYRGMWPARLRPAVDEAGGILIKEENDASDRQTALVYSRRGMDGTCVMESRPAGVCVDSRRMN